MALITKHAMPLMAWRQQKGKEGPLSLCDIFVIFSPKILFSPEMIKIANDGVVCF